jgi:hypothetical protein
MPYTPSQRRAGAAVEHWRRRGDHRAARELLLSLTATDRAEVVSMTDTMHTFAGHTDAQLQAELHDLAASGASLAGMEHKRSPLQVATVDGGPVKAAGTLEPVPELPELEVAPGTFAGILGHADNLDAHGERLGRKALERAVQAFEPPCWRIKDGHDGEPVAEVIEATMRGPALWIEALWHDTPEAMVARDRVAKSLRTGVNVGLSLELSGLIEQNGYDGWPEVVGLSVNGGAVVVTPANSECRIVASDDPDGRRVAL